VRLIFKKSGNAEERSVSKGDLSASTALTARPSRQRFKYPLDPEISIPYSSLQRRFEAQLAGAL
jgi:hypothetical protein